MSEFFKKLVKHNKESASIEDSELFNERDLTELPVYLLNIAYSGRLRGGLGSGLHFWAAPSKHFKTLAGLICVGAYLKKYPDAICFFYDSEFGSTLSYWKSAGIDLSRVIHIPIRNVEDFKFDIVGKLEMMVAENDGKKEKQKAIIFIDSIGNLASKKEVQDAIDEKSVADMTRAKALKGLFRIITPYLTLEQIPCVAVNHVYSEQGMFPKTIMSGGTGGQYSATNIFFISKAQERETDPADKKEKLSGFTFKIKAEKSRYVKEQSIFPMTVNFKGGISKYTGLLDIACELGSVTKPKNAWYKREMFDPSTGEVIEDKLWRKSQLNAEWWETLFKQSDFEKRVEERYRLPTADIIAADIKDFDDGEEDASEE